MVDDKRQQFEHMYLPQACYAGLPLFLILGPAESLGNVIPELWEAPADQELIGVLHRLFDYYADMSGARREVDRRFKNKPKDKSRGLRAEHVDIARLEVWDDMEPEPSKFDKIVAVIAKQKKLRCPRCNRGRWLGHLTVDQPPPPLRQISIACVCGMYERTLTVSDSLLKKAARATGLNP